MKVVITQPIGNENEQSKEAVAREKLRAKRELSTWEFGVKLSVRGLKLFASGTSMRDAA